MYTLIYKIYHLHTFNISFNNKYNKQPKQNIKFNNKGKHNTKKVINIIKPCAGINITIGKAIINKRNIHKILK